MTDRILQDKELLFTFDSVFVPFTSVFHVIFYFGKNKLSGEREAVTVAYLRFILAFACVYWKQAGEIWSKQNHNKMGTEGE